MTNNNQNNLLDLAPIQKFIKGVGKGVQTYFSSEKGCIVGLGDDGYLYAFGLYQWLGPKNKSISFTTMDDNGEIADEQQMVGRKILIVDNDIISGKTYKKTMEMMRAKKDKLKIKSIKFAVLCDRSGLADYAVEDYSSYAPWSLERLDGVDLKIIQALAEDGRKSFVDIAKGTGLSPVGIKNRVERLINDGILQIKGLLNMEKVCSVSVIIGVECDRATCQKLIEKFEKHPLVYNLVKVSGTHKSLIVGIVAPNLATMAEFVEKNIKSEIGVRYVEVNVGDLPIIPKGWSPLII